MKNTKIKAYSVLIKRSIVDETILVLAYTLGQLDMFLKEHYGDREYEVAKITLVDSYDKIITPEIK